MATSALSRLHLAAARGFLLPLLAPQPFHPTLLLCSSKGIVSAPMPLPPILSFAPDEEKPASQSVCGAVAHTQGKKCRCEVAWMPKVNSAPFRSLLIFHTKAPRHTNKLRIKQICEQTLAISTHQKQMPPSAALPFPPLPFVSHGGNNGDFPPLSSNPIYNVRSAAAVVP